MKKYKLAGEHAIRFDVRKDGEWRATASIVFPRGSTRAQMAHASWTALRPLLALYRRKLT